MVKTITLYSTTPADERGAYDPALFCAGSSCRSEATVASPPPSRRRARAARNVPRRAWAAWWGPRPRFQPRPRRRGGPLPSAEEGCFLATRRLSARPGSPYWRRGRVDEDGGDEEMDAADDVRHHLPSQEEVGHRRRRGHSWRSLRRRSHAAPDEVAEGNPPGGILEAPAPPEADASCQVARGVRRARREWAGVNDDGDFGPRVEGALAREGARRPRAGPEQPEAVRDSEGRTVTSKERPRPPGIWAREREHRGARPRARHQKRSRGLGRQPSPGDRARRPAREPAPDPSPRHRSGGLEQKTGQKRRGPDPEPGLAWTLSLPRLLNTSPYIATKTRRVA